ncbi:hypothetical protein F4680DRAFT_463591 [Xylaria scruposa]|nr:hypothetical protein F4680DRAFT_463591 [Xylaria scruposa]
MSKSELNAKVKNATQSRFAILSWTSGQKLLHLWISRPLNFSPIDQLFSFLQIPFQAIQAARFRFHQVQPTQVSCSRKSRRNSSQPAVLKAYLHLYLVGTVIRHGNTSREFPTERMMSLQDIWGPEYDPINGLKLVLSKSSKLKVAWTDLHRYFQGYSGSLIQASAQRSIRRTLLGLGGGWVYFRTDERLCLLNQLEVKVGDVMGNADIGRIAFAMKDKVLPVLNGRFYE